MTAPGEFWASVRVSGYAERVELRHSSEPGSDLWNIQVGLAHLVLDDAGVRALQAALNAALDPDPVATSPVQMQVSGVITPGRAV